ncbi:MULTISPECIES: DUF4870 domain-containing protein [unclassified Thioalkalivibrio]|uniref:DUF4870 family protein n=1 Tax=unclassified Thioalkalivibrio TaxID=2621013 RepID=UPI00037698CB|nr:MULTISPECIES: DUF4870 domain-containing protein [unclassified Thioalkalivibrio]
MSEGTRPEVEPSDVSRPVPGPRKERTMVTVVYVLYLVSFLTALTAIAGLIIAYIKRNDGDAVSDTHFTYQIRTFWIGLLGVIVGAVLTPIGIGFLVLLFMIVWLLVRCIKGLLANNEDRSIEQPETWLW